MGWFSDDSDQAIAYDTVTNNPHKASWSHELIAGAASYEAAKAYENHLAQNGQPASHAEAKELLYVLHRICTKCLSWWSARSLTNYISSIDRSIIGLASLVPLSTVRWKLGDSTLSIGRKPNIMLGTCILPYPFVSTNH